MTWIEPLELETWIISVFAGSPAFFLAIALIFIFSLAGYFRMNIMTTMFMLVIFLLMFAAYVSSVILFLVLSIGLLILGVWIWRPFSR